MPDKFLPTIVSRGVLTAGFFILSVFQLVSAQLVSAPLPVDEKMVVRDRELNPQQLKSFEVQTKDLVELFQRYLSVIADPEQPDPIRENAIENALKMFVDSAYIEVGSLRNTRFTRSFPLSVYLQRVKNLGKTYGRVQITSYGPVIVNGWEQVSGDRYRTTATFFQKFEGLRNGRLVYADKTAKQVEVNLNFISNPYYLDQRWAVLLGSVTIKEITAAR
jgi:hypothetical protein